MNSKTLTRLVGGVLVGGMLLSAGGVALAQDDNVTKAPNGSWKNFSHSKAWHKPGMMGHRGGFGHKGQGLFGANLDQLVKDGVLNQTKADQIKAYVDKMTQQRQAEREKFKQMTPEQRKAEFDKLRQHKDLMQQLVDNKILTQAEADNVKAKLREQAQAQHQQRISAGLKTLVDQGTITQAQADKVVQQFTAVQKDHQALFEKLKGMTPQERKEYFQQNKANLKKDPLSSLVTDGTLTQAQATAIKGIFHQQRPKKMK